MNDSTFERFLSTILYQIPLLLVLLVALVMALLRMHKAPRAAVLVMLSVALWGLAIVGGALIQAYLVTQLMVDPQMRSYLTLSSVVNNVLRAVACLLLVIAAFSGRQARDHHEEDYREMRS